ncbi:MAG: allophanate hydrolase, partial [Roseinatronobacter sp.]|nr:allophanate hydrolase [Roseinatronobacter sp.]
MFDADKLSELSFDARSLASAYGAGLTPCEVVAEVLRRLRAADDPGIFLYLPDSDALMDAAHCLGDHNPDLPLWGLPFAVKDNIDVAHWPTTAGCDAFAYIAETDAPAVAALRRAGALVIGKTNLDQFATGLVGLRTSSPAPRNAIDPALVPGGSSSGSAVAVAKGIVSFALGTDTAGSGRVPAALNGIVGLKPTLGAISRSGVVPACRTLDTISIFALTTADARAVLHVAAFPDQTDAFSRSLRLPPAEGFAPALRLGVPNAQSREFFGDMLQAASFSATLERLTEMGFELREVDFTPFYNVANLLYSGAWGAERMTVIEPLLRSNPEAIHPVTREVISAADKLSAADAFRGIYQLAELRRETEQVLASVDMLCVPSIPTLYSCADLAADPFGPNTRLGTYTNFVNLLDLCGIAIPAIPRSDTRPGSVTFLGRAGQDNLCLAVAQALEQALLLPMGATGQQ